MDNMVDAKIIEGMDYSFLAVAYDESDDVLYFATADGETFDPAMKSVYSVPIAAINNVNVISNSDTVTSDGRHLSRGCTIKLDAKEADFGWAWLKVGSRTESSRSGTTSSSSSPRRQPTSAISSVITLGCFRTSSTSCVKRSSRGNRSAGRHPFKGTGIRRPSDGCRRCAV